MKMADDPKLEKLFEGMSRETARKVANQGSPRKKDVKKPTKNTKKK